jgi:hypothetical protein
MSYSSAQAIVLSNNILIIRMKKVNEGAVVAAEVDIGEINLFGASSQPSNYSSPLPHCRKRPQKHH